MAKAIFQKKALEASANFNVFESQCRKIRILSKALSVLSGVTNLSTSRGYLTTITATFACLSIFLMREYGGVVPQVCDWNMSRF